MQKFYENDIKLKVVKLTIVKLAVMKLALKKIKNIMIYSNSYKFFKKFINILSNYF